MTGMTLKHDGRYYLFYGAMVDRVQRIGVAVSDDLMKWKKVDHPILEAAGPYYEADPSQSINYETAWRDPYVFYQADDDCFYAFICARAADWSSDVGGGCIAVARSQNLLDWELLPPAYISESATCLEVPEYFEMDSRHYLMYTTSYHFGTPYPVYNPNQSGGTFYLESDQVLAGYSAPPYDNTLSASAPPILSCYVGRSILDPHNARRRYYYYHNITPPHDGEFLSGSFSAIKYLEADDSGRIYLKYAPLLEPNTAHDDTVKTPLTKAKAIYLADYDIEDGIFELTANVPYAGLCFHVNYNSENNLEGLAVWLSPESIEGNELWVMLGSMTVWSGPNGERVSLGGPLALGRLENISTRNRHMRIVSRGTFIDVYIDDQLHISHALPSNSRQSTSTAGAFYVGVPKNNAVENLTIRIFT
jgi:hypothetical protein